ncbi:hypothetical protein BJ875DRAFT_382194 [Amylocarpus encephaloides]|uniref:NADH dehydrogenase [ubiquinone] 1 alpha subcomplex subunit n=1 Tax=Amylocarpus encephaloides TaxID=45428 RepID=A0A9P7YE95_9HELO|nr:hypothetical protein BJ875DRAFT_382194 [Amylocarpus encephaloides]
MSSRPTGPIKAAWYKWKSQRWVPWRKRFLVGLDLHGNTFWEFRDTLSSHKHRMRRIVRYPTAAHLSDVDVGPQWLQWLRHTRKEAPSLAEQAQDVVRVENLKILAARADQRWREKASVLDAPGGVRGQPLPAIGVGMAADATEEQRELHGESEGPRGTGDAQGSREGRSASKPKEQAEDPWKQARGGPSEQWQPQAWGGDATSR